MFSKTLFFVLSFFMLLVAATTTTITEHPPSPSPTTSGDCNQINYHPVCCTVVLDEKPAPATSAVIGLITGLLSIVIDAGTELLGINCLPIIGDICTGTVLCCENNSFGSLINIGCVNIII